MFTLDQARSFIAVAEELHFGRAAVRLNMTQPPLSRQIQQLEDEIGMKLLERDARPLRLTEAGQRYAADCRRILEDVEQADDAAAGVMGHFVDVRSL